MTTLVCQSNGVSTRKDARNAPTWQQVLKDAVRDPVELCRMLGLSDEITAQAVRASRSFGVFAPRGYIGRMRHGDPTDPLLRQVLPLDAELETNDGFSADPVRDSLAVETPGLLRKYPGRVLMVATGACAVHCRYCFRRHFPYEELPRSLARWEPALEVIRSDSSIQEVILSGGDPLTLVDDWLARLVERLDAIPHLRRLRVHTRLPIVIPERVNAALIRWLTATRLAPVMVIHANHAAELDEAVESSLRRLAQAGVPLLNQTVLLKGVNDRLDVLEELSLRLVDCRVMPYYLHQLDRVQGAAHFEVPEQIGRRLVAQLRRRLPGYAVPRYVREVPGGSHKYVLR